METITKQNNIYIAVNNDSFVGNDNLSFILKDNYYHINKVGNEYHLLFDGTEYLLDKDDFKYSFKKVKGVKNGFDLVIINAPEDIDNFLNNTDCSYTQVYEKSTGEIFDLDGYSCSLVQQYWKKLNKDNKDKILYGFTSDKTGKNIPPKSLKSFILLCWKFQGK